HAEVENHLHDNQQYGVGMARGGGGLVSDFGALRKACLVSLIRWYSSRHSACCSVSCRPRSSGRSSDSSCLRSCGGILYRAENSCSFSCWRMVCRVSSPFWVMDIRLRAFSP